jgi:hypothetical protein
MPEKLETYLAPPFGSRPATRTHYVKSLIVGTLMSATAFLASHHLFPTRSLGSIIHAPQSAVGHVHVFDDLRDWIAHEAQFGHRKIFDRELAYVLSFVDGDIDTGTDMRYRARSNVCSALPSVMNTLHFLTSSI